MKKGRVSLSTQDYERVQSAYFGWLLSIIGVPSGDPNIELIRYLHEKTFYDKVPNDDNRAKDGEALRSKFSDAHLKSGDEEYLRGPCSVLEMLVALAQRIDYNMYEPGMGNRTGRWFFEMIGNLRLAKLAKSSEGFEANLEYNNLVIQNFLERGYTRTGLGGLFPQKHPTKDQRTVELWYQMAEYYS